jgi:hypothetical protein
VLVHHHNLGFVVGLGPREDSGTGQQPLFALVDLLNLAGEQLVEGVASEAQLRAGLLRSPNDLQRVFLCYFLLFDFDRETVRFALARKIGLQFYFLCL